MKNKLLLLAFSMLLMFTACQKKDVNNPIEEARKGVIVVNEGLFGQNNSSLTYYDLEKKKTTQNVYENANKGSKLGDTANDMKIKGDKGFVVVNQSNKVEIIDVKNFESIGSVDFTSYGGPRYICIVDDNAYVTTYGDNVVKFSTADYKVSKEIKVGSKPEGIAYNSGYLFVANSAWGSGDDVSVIDAQTDSTVKNIKVGVNPRFVLSDSKFVYVICSDNYFAPTGRQGVYKIDVDGLTLADSLIFPDSPSKAAIGKGKLFVIHNAGVASIDLNTFTVTNDSLVSASAVNSLGYGIYSIAFNSDDNNIYLSNPKDYTQNGEVAYFDLSGKEKGRFETGINPGTIVFVSE